MNALENSRPYYLQRAAEARDCAEKAQDPDLRDLLSNMAERYEGLAAKLALRGRRDLPPKRASSSVITR